MKTTIPWADPWFRQLSPELKLFFLWLRDNKVNDSFDAGLAAFQIGADVPDEIPPHFADQLKTSKPTRAPREPKDRPDSRKECADYAHELGLPHSDGHAFYDGKEANGWKNGRNPVRDWKATMRNWKANGYHPSQKGADKANPAKVYKSNGRDISMRLPSIFDQNSQT